MKARIVVLTLAVIMLCHSVLNAQETEISESARQTPETSRKTVFFPLIIREECESLKNLPEDEDLSLKSGEIDSARQVRARGNAKPEDVLKDKTFSNRFENYLIGTMPNNGQGSDITCGTSDQTIASGYWSTANTVKGDADLVPGNIVSGVNIFGVTGTSWQASGTAAAGDVLSGKTFSNSSGVGIAGTMLNNGEGSDITCGASDQTIASGYWSTANIVKGDADLVPGNIVSGVNIFGVTGTSLQASGTAAAGDVLSGKTFSNSSGVGIAGTMPARGSGSDIRCGTSDQTIASGYWSTANIVKGDAGLVPGNIKSGVTIFGVSGDINVADTSSGDVQASEMLAGRKAWVDGHEVTGTSRLIPNCSGTMNGTRWCDNLDGTVTDMTTGLVWLKYTGCFIKHPWQAASYTDAHSAVGKTYDGSPDFDCGLSDKSTKGEWRFPTKNELYGLANGTEAVRPGTPRAFSSVQDDPYWSGTTRANDIDDAWYIEMGNGGAYAHSKERMHYVWPVRSKK